MKRAIECGKRCMRRVKAFTVRAVIVLAALGAVFAVMVFTGELVPFSLVMERVAEALGYALADTMADPLDT
jgi:hypothetical protein